ncbi:hypothetical protein [Vibrio parahaemolyticus]|uniref:hypothetical protein n=1 Tax=Vibrio parahaemolyticus TaxID=670 RepID=UPI00111FB409|nr:hypothetical protein [Vibrio parahaemolyticus]EGQ9250183.1 hypothetical protein [Vibrio parahaemolyticus]EJG1192771.1 hypothetical protein [Vibrio parahaemolyticus]EJU9841406.1 hypothetical protein [Vibrio parahaemolyticus]EKO5219648.1 hypothetical protein [Vibrio parahaemolyticus]ELB2269863.1 hypothetical protein [Vibrio parahaemolyticus]
MRKSWIKCIPLLILSCISFSSYPSELPSFGETILGEQFPEYVESSSNIERGLRRYRVQLEVFREDVLEGYNRGVQEYREKLVAADTKLELDRKKGRIPKDDYQKQHNYIKEELDRSKGSGQYMKAYFTYLRKYKSESKWVVKELGMEEKRKFKF